jgi:menaquinone-dependent protoporphyrinogen oxidase
MSAVVIYMSLHGCAEKAAMVLKEMSWKEVDLINLRDQVPPRLDAYDTVIVGGSIHIGEIQGKIRKFCDEHENELITKRLGLFICHMQEGETARRQFKEAFSEKLRAHAAAKGLFGGEFNIDRMDYYERKLIKKATGVDKNIDNINFEAILGFGKVIFHLDKS